MNTTRSPFNISNETFPNLDCFSCPSDLVKFRLECKHLEKTLALLRSYAEAKENAMRSRLAGKINNAIRFEQASDKVYEMLPEWAKW